MRIPLDDIDFQGKSGHHSRGMLIATPGRHERDMALEGLRGLCALLVIFGHMTFQAPVLDPGYACDLLHIDYGPDAVFVFFVISGYVIGLTAQSPATGPSIRHYCSRRLLRIVPIAWTAVLATWLLLRHDSAAVAGGNLLFLQNSLPYPFGVHIPVLYDDPPLWSLSYEMLYYALFILVWKCSSRLGAVFAATILAAFADVLGFPVIFSRYAAYFVFWMCGLCIAWHAQQPPRQARSAWPSALGAAFVIWRLEPVHTLCGVASARLKGFDPDRFRIDVLLGSVLIVLAVTRRAPALQRRLGAACILLGFCVLPFKLWNGTLSYVEILGAAVLCLCFLARKWTPSLRPFAVLAPVGLVSYALYATAYPLMRAVYRCPALPSGSAGSFLLRALIYGALCAAAAVFLERIMQQRWVRWMTAMFRLRSTSVPQTAPLPRAGA
jgi:peptidoglycan/LPS O-acetylase OafA/YrhL